MDNTNLLQEIIDLFKDEHVKEEDVLWVMTDDASCSWQEFKAMADFNYDSGFGIEYVNLNLEIIGKNFKMFRGEYDGSEYWIFVSFEKPKKPKKSLEVADLLEKNVELRMINNKKIARRSWERDNGSIIW